MKFNEFISHFHIVGSRLYILDHLKVFIIRIPSFPEKSVPAHITTFFIQVKLASVYFGIVIKAEGNLYICLQKMKWVLIHDNNFISARMEGHFMNFFIVVEIGNRRIVGAERELDGNLSNFLIIVLINHI